MQEELFPKEDPYKVFKLTTAQKRNGKRGVKRCKMILDKATGASIRDLKKKR